MSVRTACLIIEGDSLAGEGPAAFLPVAGMPLIERVAQRMAAAGVEQIVLLAPAQWPVLKRIATELKQRGLTVSTVKRVGDLADFIRADRPLLIVQDGILPSRLLVEDALARRDSVIYTRPVASSDDRHERIDLADRWTGLAVVPGSLVHDLDPQPEDWSAGSALLRRAVQLGIDRITLDITRGSGRRADMLRSMADCKAAEARLIGDHFSEKAGSYGGFLPGIGRWLARRTLPKLWQRNVPSGKLAIASVGLGVLTLLFALAGLIVPALVIGLVALLGRELVRHHLAFVAGRSGRTDSEAGLIVTLLLAISVPVATIATHGLTLTAVCAGIMLPLSLLAMTQLRAHLPAGKWQFDGFSAAILVLILILVDIDTVPALLAVSVAGLARALLSAMRDAVKAALTPKSLY